ncbi:MAG: small multi-drug export protein [Nanoarchaeota archaeon]|nr:small multi-drug export protein [Nanoarchaeota archaeon]
MINLLKVALLSILPISELRGGIPLGLALGMNPLLVYIIAVFFNFLSIPITFFFLDNLHSYFLKNKHYSLLFTKYISRNRKKLEKAIGTKAEFWALMLVVLIPLPFTGAYTGTILAWFFGLKRKKAYLAILLGILIAGIIVTLASLGVIALI